VSAILERPEAARWLLVLGHGAGAGMRHRFMEAAAAALATHGIATFRYQFPYMEKRTARPDPQPVLLATVRSALAAAHAAAGDLPILAGGKSMGGRMTSLALAEKDAGASGVGGAGAPAIPRVRGLVFFGFPLHPAGAPATSRADHLDRVAAPMLFLQGTRDKLAELGLLEPVIAQLGARATLHVVDDADHSFEVPKRTGRNAADVLEELAEVTAAWADGLP
jgi:predicted alpha/beta-hydrolase family hydrolase